MSHHNLSRMSYIFTCKTEAPGPSEVLKEIDARPVKEWSSGFDAVVIDLTGLDGWEKEIVMTVDDATILADAIETALSTIRRNDA